MRLAAALTLALWGCGPGLPPVQLETAGVALNEAVRLVLPGPVDPLSVTGSSVQLVAPDGRRLPHDAWVEGPLLRVRLVVDEATWQAPPESMEVVLAGRPSPHALTLVGGAQLAAPVSRRVTLRPVLAPSSTPPRLVTVDGHPPADEVQAVGAVVGLAFRGVLRPETLRGSSVLLEPRLGTDLPAEPVAPRALAWRIRGERTEVDLELPEGAGAWRLHTRRLALADDRGRTPGPLLVLDWERSFPQPVEGSPPDG